ncbi:transposable element Tcb2 transposase [Trichonephila clavipes]|nr:transposable element Tcb2 transposase [Trichonephila clavipes]
MTAQLYVHDILQPLELQLMQRLPGAIFQQGNDRLQTSRVSQDWLCTVTTLPWPARFPDLSPIEHIWDHLGCLLEVNMPHSLKPQSYASNYRFPNDAAGSPIVS